MRKSRIWQVSSVVILVIRAMPRTASIQYSKLAEHNNTDSTRVLVFWKDYFQY